MSAAKLSKQLQRELKANPQKAGALGLLCLVAAYFWGPLIFKSDPKKPVPAAAAPVAATTPTTTPETMTTPSSNQHLDWRTLSNKLKTDPSMRSVTGKSDAEIARSPFDAPVKEVKETTPDDDLFDLLAEAEADGLFDEQPVITKQMTSAVLNTYPLRLTSTLVGSRARTAIINGKAYSSGATLGKLNDVEMVLENVRARSVVIAWNGMRRELRIPKPGETPPGPPPDESELTAVKNDDETIPTETTGEAAEYLNELSERNEKRTN